MVSMATNRFNADGKGGYFGTVGALGTGIIAAILGALGGHAHAGSAFATEQCTRYMPSTTPNVNCYHSTLNQVGLTPGASTASTAIRDQNEVAISHSDSWEVEYAANSRGYYDSTIGKGTFGEEGGDGGIQAKALCQWLNNPVSNVNECTTTWH
jgi:hypothetical protein